MIETVIAAAQVCEAVFSLLTLCTVVFIAGEKKRNLRCVSRVAKSGFASANEKKKEMSLEERRLATELENIDNYGTDKAQKDIL